MTSLLTKNDEKRLKDYVDGFQAGAGGEDVLDGDELSPEFERGYWDGHAQLRFWTERERELLLNNSGQD